MLFGLNLELFGAETSAAVTAEARDASQNIYPLTVEYVGKVTGFDFSQVVMRFPDNTPANQTLFVTVRLRGQASNEARITMK
jgi:hypothetical protein